MKGRFFVEKDAAKRQNIEKTRLSKKRAVSELLGDDEEDEVAYPASALAGRAACTYLVSALAGT